MSDALRAYGDAIKDTSRSFDALARAAGIDADWAAFARRAWERFYARRALGLEDYNYDGVPAWVYRVHDQMVDNFGSGNGAS